MILEIQTNIHDKDSFQYFCYYCGTHGITINVQGSNVFVIECGDENYKDLENLSIMYNFKIEFISL
jgi:hypothetical protein